jgi:serine/threonine protein kinase
MSRFLVAVREFNGSHVSFSVGDVLKNLDDGKEGYFSIYHNREQEYVPEEYFKPVGALDQRAFQEQDFLGEGACGRVTTVIHPETPGTVFAKKTIRLHLTEETNEVYPHWLMDHHRHVIDIVKVFRDRGRDMDTLDSLSFVMLPVAKHNLEQHLQMVASESNDAQFGMYRMQIFRWINCLATTLAELHKENIIHRDIKPQNILVDAEEILYTDFGISYEMEVATECDYTNTDGTYEWMAPEVIKSDRDPNEKSARAGRKGDVFSLGSVIYEMLLTATPGRFANNSLPSRQNEEVLAYHLTVVNDGGFVNHVESFQESYTEVECVLGPGHSRYVGMTEDLLSVVAREMLVLKHERVYSDAAAVDLRNATEDRHFSFWCWCCNSMSKT